MIGVFLAFDIILFYVFFELTLVPLFFLIGIWGGPERRYAARKFFIYTLAGSLITLLGVLGVVLACYQTTTTGVLTFSIPQLVRDRPDAAGDRRRGCAAFWRSVQLWVFLALIGRLRDQGAAVPAAHLAAAGPRRGADGRQRAAGRRAAQDRHLRLPAALPAAGARTRASTIGVPLIGTLAVIGIIYGALLRLRPGRHQEAGRLQLASATWASACSACSPSTRPG